MTAAKVCLPLMLFLFYLPVNAQHYAVIIHEIMADPQPPVGLPDAEFIELRNRSASAINLQGWRLQAGNATTGAFPAYLLPPDSLVVVTSRTNTALFGKNTISVPSFPALPNGGTTLRLLNGAGAQVHAVAYTGKWYGTAEKATGGWSLEMIDAANPCGGAANWQAAQHPAGGTPGRPNSVATANGDGSPPVLLAATTPDNLHLVLRFNEPMDSSAAALLSNYQSQPQLAIIAAAPQPPLYMEVLLTLQQPLVPGLVYTLKVGGVADCAGNAIGSRNNVPAGLPQIAAAGDVVINEILFNPKKDGSDYVELFNKSKRIIDLNKFSLVSNAAPAIAGAGQNGITTEPAYLFPGQFAVVTEDREAVLRQYLVKNEDLLLEVTSLPSLPDDKGTLSLLNGQGQVLDALAYHHNWHFALITNKEGVALERIDPAGPTQQSSNWTSAAASAGFGTPTYQNSQLHSAATIAMAWNIVPQVVSPDGDGFDDVCTISYQLDAPNYVANLRIFSAGGRLVRHLVQNETVSQNGFWRWNGLGDANGALPTGNYILLLEVFNLQGKKQQWKKSVVLARRR